MNRSTPPMPDKTPTVRCRLVKTRVEIETASPVKVFAENGAWWTAGGNDMVPLRGLNVVGVAEDSGRQYPLNWMFEFTPEEFGYFGVSLGVLRKPVSEEDLSGDYEIDICVEVTAWLTIGLVRRAGEQAAYLRFTKAGQTLTANLPDLPAIEALRETLY